MQDATHKLAGERPPSPVVQNRVSLLFTWGEEVRALALREGQSAIVGRAEPASFVIDDRSLSRTHARISVRNGEVTLEDLGSTNGSSVNGSRVRQAVLNESDVAQLGTIELRVASRSVASGRAAAGLSHADFMRQLADELQRARLFGRALSVLALRASGHEAEPAAIQLALRPVDRLCRFAPGLSLLLLLESDAQAASAWLDGLRRSSKQPWTAGVASYPALACGSEELVTRALDAAHKAEAGTTFQASLAEPDESDAPLILSPAMRRLYELVERAARTRLPVLVLGETGSGKELVARAVHERSLRAKAPFKALNCATIPANLIESVLFGHERGAFTGAERQTPGIFEQAQKGTVFLDEVGDLAPQAQAALLRVLEQHRVVRIGGTRELDVDVRIVAATHRNLAAMVAAGTFREDLMFRLDALSLYVPPLRDRKEEIAPLAQLFLRRARAHWGASAQGLSEDALDAMVNYAWPGNVRQLKNVIDRAVAVCAGNLVELEDLPPQLWAEPAAIAAEPRVSEGNGGIRSLPDRVRDFEIELIREAMARAQGNQAQAARLLGVPRRTLANKVHAYELLGASDEAAVRQE